jgi:hypothetical protein
MGLGKRKQVAQSPAFADSAVRALESVPQNLCTARLCATRCPLGTSQTPQLRGLRQPANSAKNPQFLPSHTSPKARCMRHPG